MATADWSLRSIENMQKHNLHVGHTRPCKILNHYRHNPIPNP